MSTPAEPIDLEDLRLLVSSKKESAQYWDREAVAAEAVGNLRLWRFCIREGSKAWRAWRKLHADFQQRTHQILP